MVRDQYFSHVAKDGTTVVPRIRAAGYLSDTPDWTVGENLAWGSGSFSRRPPSSRPGSTRLATSATSSTASIEKPAWPSPWVRPSKPPATRAPTCRSSASAADPLYARSAPLRNRHDETEQSRLWAAVRSRRAVGPATVACRPVRDAPFVASAGSGPCLTDSSTSTAMAIAAPGTARGAAAVTAARRRAKAPAVGDEIQPRGLSLRDRIRRERIWRCGGGYGSNRPWGGRTGV